jgi:membrane associated rhomboid family serine protease
VENEHPDWMEPSATVDRFARLADARELGLVLAARAIAYCIVREGKEWLVQVEQSRLAAATEEWVAYQAVNQRGPAVEVPLEDEAGRPGAPHSSVQSLWVAACVVVVFAVIQAEREPGWRDAGLISVTRGCGQGEWWRVLTALTLHADVPHVLSNLLSGLWFVRWLIAAHGAGVSWLAVVVAGGLGNALNVWFYYPEDHRSLGASTAVFGALGLLVGNALGTLFLTPPGRSWWRWVLPLGAGLALLSHWGAGGGDRGRVDVAAHVWGFACGLPLGVPLGWFHIGRRLPSWAQYACAAAALVLLCGAWGMALAAA